MWLFKIFIFPENNNKWIYKRNKNNFLIFLGPTRINHRSYVSPFMMENQGYVVLCEKPIWEKIWFLFGEFWKHFYDFLVFLIIWKWVSHDASGWTEKKLNKENCFFIFSSLYIFFIFFRKINLKNWCHRTRVVRQTLKEMKKTIFYDF